MESIGFALMPEHVKKEGKLGYWLWERCEPKAASVQARWKNKRLEFDGPKKNNFCILLP